MQTFFSIVQVIFSFWLFFMAYVAYKRKTKKTLAMFLVLGFFNFLVGAMNLT